MSLIKLIRFYTVFLVCVSIMSSICVPAYATSSGDPPERSHEFDANVASMITKAESNGRMPVIVRLRVGFIPEGDLNTGISGNSSVVATASNSANKIGVQRLAIKTAQDAVIGLLSQGVQGASSSFVSNANRLTVYKTIPYIALSATADEIELLSQDQNVVSIDEDIPKKGVLSGSVPLIDGDIAFTQGYSGAGQTVAVLDSGVRVDHQFFAGKIVSEACYSGTFGLSLCPGGVRSTTALGSGTDCPLSLGGCGHGTHVAGIAVGSDGQLSGVAKDANLIIIKTASDPNNGGEVTHYNADIVKGLMRVYELRNQYKIAAVNMSIGGGLFQTTCDIESHMIKNAIDQLRSVGIATVVAAGNGFSTDGMSSPACISSAISVGNTVSTTAPIFFDNVPFLTNEVWADSNISSETDVLAPGLRIISSVANSTTSFGSNSGTSMSSPHVAGAFAVLRSKNPDASVQTILDALKDTGLSVTDQRPGGSHTVPRIDIDDALAELGGEDTSTQLSADGQPITISQPTEDAVDTYFVDVSDGATSLTVQMNGGSGDADLYVRFGAEPTFSVYDCRPFRNGNNETCQFDNPSEGRWYVMVHAYTPYSGATLSATVETGSNPPAGEFTPISPSGTINTNQPAFTWTAKSTVTNGETYAVRARDAAGVLQVWNAVTATQAGCGSGAGTCSYTHSTAVFAEGSGGYWKVQDNESNFSSTLNFTVDTGSNPPTDQIVDACQEGQTAVGNVQLFAEAAVCLQDVADGGQHQMHFFVDADKVGSTLEIILSHGSGNGTLLHKLGGRPDGTIFDHISNNSGNEEKILVENVQAQWNYIHVQAEAAYSGATLLVRYQ